MSRVAMQFDDPQQQFVSASLGMWIFLATEALLFSGLFLGYAVYRYEYAEAFAAGSHHLGKMTGAVMTALLLLSSLSIALADHTIEKSHQRKTFWLLTSTCVLGVVFLVLKFHEYWKHYQDHLVPGIAFDRQMFSDQSMDGRAVELFYCFYYFMTGLHAFHMIVGVALVGLMMVLTSRGHFSDEYSTPIAMTGLYWHFVDIVWVFLYPLLYLMGGSG